MITYTRRYSYDKLGNMQQVKQLGTSGFTRNFVYHTGKNTLQKIETAAPALLEDFTYDNCGNQLTAGTTRNYVWNAANQLITYKNQMGSNDPTIFAQYDYSGMNRLSKMVKTGSAGSPVYERTIYIDGVFEYHILENGITYEKNYVHVMDDTSRIAMVRVGDQFPDDISDNVTYNLEDQIGSSSTRLNTSGGVIDKEEYYPFGDSSLRTFSKKRYRYVGKEKDLESGLYYYGARYYAAWTCRFISIDPLAADYPFLTPYNYAGNKPITFKDIDGMQSDGDQPVNNGGGTGQYISVENSGINLDVHAVETDDGTRYSFSLGDQEFDNIGIVEWEGNQYFDLGQAMYYGDDGWSATGTADEQMTQWVYTDIQNFDSNTMHTYTWGDSTLTGNDHRGIGYPKNINCAYLAEANANATGTNLQGGVVSPAGALNSSGGRLTQLDNTDAIDYINSQLEAGNSIVVGVNYARSGTDSVGTDHYVTITGRTTVNEEGRFLYIENATSNAANARDFDSNQLTPSNTEITGSSPHWHNTQYNVSRVQRNR